MNNIKFKDFLNLYNFRYLTKVTNLENDYQSKAIRIYPQREDYDKDFWFEIGVFDFSSKKYMFDILNKSLSKEIMNGYIYSINHNLDNNVLEIFLCNNRFYERED